MKKVLSALLLTITSFAFASYDQAPPAFAYQDGKVAYIDITSAEHSLEFDANASSAQVVTVLKFYSNSNGYPLFDLIPEPTLVTLDGVEVSTEAIRDPDMESTLRVVKANTEAGEHVLIVKHVLAKNVVTSLEGISSGFWTSDLSDRGYMEQYLPTNVEFDQFQKVLNVKVINAEGRPHLLKANGTVKEISENEFQVVYPAFHSTSSSYFHLFPANNGFKTTQFNYRSLDGRDIPVDIYTIYDAEVFAASTRTILDELENDYGPFPHDKVVIYGNAPSGGMEYSGATITSLSALGHELFHSYHARGLMPANGNAGWMDEAMARWRDNKYPKLEKLAYERTQLAGHSVWTRKTDRMAYTEGSQFLSWVDYRMNEKGASLRTYLREYFQKHKYTTVTTELFRDELIEYSGLELKADFFKYIYGKTDVDANKRTNYVMMDEMMDEQNPHPKYSESQLKDMTWPF